MKKISPNTKNPLDVLPIICPHTEWFLSTFSRLNASRNIGLNVNPIAISEIITYANSIFHPYSLEFIIDLIQTMDGEYMKELRDSDGHQDQDIKINQGDTLGTPGAHLGKNNI